MSYSGYEIMTTYNALNALGEDVSVETVVELIVTYEKYGAVLGGKWGTSPYAERNDTVVVNAYNNENDITAMIHTVSITKEESGTYSVHNAYCKDEYEKY